MRDTAEAITNSVDGIIATVPDKDRANAIMVELQTLGDNDASKKQSLIDEFTGISSSLEGIANRINGVIDDAGLGITGVPRIDETTLSDIKLKSSATNALDQLKLIDFSEIKANAEKAATGSGKVFRRLLGWFARFVESDFIASTINLRKIAEREMLDKHIALKELIQKSEDFPEDKACSDAAGNLALVEIQEPLARAVSLLFGMRKSGKVAEVGSRLFYAFLADGLVLLIGFSLRRKKTTIFRTKKRQDLNNDEPRLIAEALYNLAARKPESQVSGEPEIKTYDVENLLCHINDFLSHFEIQSFMKDPNLNVMFSLVCKDTSVIDKKYLELVVVLKALNFIKPLSKEQYVFFTRYKRQKALMEESAVKKLLDDSMLKDADSEEAYYLMTSGCALYFSEIINDLLEHVENDEIRDFIIGEVNETQKHGGENHATT
jgi:hypothetical protein